MKTSGSKGWADSLKGRASLSPLFSQNYLISLPSHWHQDGGGGWRTDVPQSLSCDSVGTLCMYK